MASAVSFVPIQSLPVTVKNEFNMNSPCVIVRTGPIPKPVGTYADKTLKTRQNVGETGLLRCKRRADFSTFGMNIPKPQTPTVSRRNERERNRVRKVNQGFETLRRHVPSGRKNKKMSKVETLRSAVEYIRQLQELLEHHDGAMMSAQFATDYISSHVAMPQDQNNSLPSPSASVGSAASSSMSYESDGSAGQNHMDDFMDISCWL